MTSRRYAAEATTSLTQGEGPWARGPYIIVNCALLERADAEFFGATRGAWAWDTLGGATSPEGNEVRLLAAGVPRRVGSPFRRSA